MPSLNGAYSARRCRHRLASIALVAVLFLPVAATAAPISLGDALARAAGQDLSRPGAVARVDAAEAATRQAGVRPNPTVGLDIENFAGSGDRQLLESTETTVYYQQTLERGAKRDARVGAARAEVTVAQLRGQVRALDLLANVQALWVEAAATDAAVGVARERLALAERLQRETARRVSAARDPLFVGERARTSVAQAQIALDQAQTAAANARAALAAYIGLAEVEVDGTALALTDGPSAALPPTSALRTADLAVLEAERDAALSRIRVEDTRARQDPTVRAGLRHFRQGGDVAFVVGGSIPLGRNDTNRGNIERARAERLALEADLALARTERDREIARLAARRAATASEVRRIDAEVLPSARRAVDLVRDGFNRGGDAFTVLEVTEAQRAVIDAEARRLELLKSYALDGARLDRLAARHTPLIASAETR